MSINERENLSDAFKAFFQTSGLNLEKKASYAFDTDDVKLSKTAASGMPVYNPTQENLESLVLSLLDDNDFSAGSSGGKLFPEGKWVEIKITNYAGPHTDVVSDATGCVHVPVAKEMPTIDFPFIVSRGELLPFDVIQVGGERVPFSRENIKKIAISMQNKAKSIANGELTGDAAALNPYVKLEDKSNPTTSVGFLGNTLHIQDKYRFPLMGDNQMYVTACHDIDDCIEKLASMTPFKWEQVKSAMLEKEARDKADEINGIFELAKTATDTNIADAMAAVDKMQWENATRLPDSTYITFPVLEGGNEIKMENGIVFSDLLKSEYGTRLSSDKPEALKNGVIILSECGKVRYLSKEDSFLCIRSKEPSKKFKTKQAKNIANGDIMLLFVDGKPMLPVKCTSQSLVTLDATTNEAAYEPKTADSYERKAHRSFSVSDGANLSFKKIRFSSLGNREVRKLAYRYEDVSPKELDRGQYGTLYVLNGADKVAKLTANEFDVLLKRNFGKNCETKPFRNYSSFDFGTYEGSYSVAPETKILVADGIINNFFKTRKELNFVLDNQEAVKGDDLVFLKTAMENETVTIECRDKKADKYDVTLSFIDKTKTLFSSRTKKFTGVPLYRVRGILGAAGFDHNRIGELCYKLRQDNHVTAPLPKSFDSDRVTGAKSKSKVLQRFGKLRRKVFDDRKVYDVASDVISQALTDTPIAKSERVRSVVMGTQKRAADALTLARHFEKLAIDNSSELYKDTAKAMLLTSQLFEKTAQMLTGDKEYPQIMGIAETIVADGEHFGRLAGSLICDKIEKIASDTSSIAPWYYQNAVDSLSDMYSLSCSYLEKMADDDEDEEDEDDDKSEQEKINMFAQLKAMAENKKEDVPGGKHTPTRFVQRKNQQRMNS